MKVQGKPIRTFLAMLRRGLGRVSLRVVLLSSFIIMVAAAAGLTGFLAFRNGQIAVYEAVHNQCAETVHRISQHLDDYLGGAQLVNRVNEQILRQGLLDEGDYEGLAHYFWEQGLLYPDTGSIGYANERGEVVGANQPERYVVLSWRSVTGSAVRRYALDGRGYRSGTVLRETPDYDARTRSWYMAAVAAGHPVWAGINVSATGQRLDETAALPYYGASGELRGVFYRDLSLAQINVFLDRIDIGENGDVFIMETNGLLVASSTSELPYTVNGDEIQRLPAVFSADPCIASAAASLAAAFPDLMTFEGNYPFALTSSEGPCLGYAAPYHDSNGLDWIIVMEAPTADFTARIDAGNRTTLGWGALVMVLATLLAAGLALWIIRPLLRLNQTAQALAAGDWTRRVASTRRDEVGQLATAFDRMADQLQIAFSSLQISESRMRALLDHIPDRVWFKDAASRYVTANAEYARVLGIPLDRMPGRSDGEFWPADLARKFAEDDAATLAGGVPRRIEERFDDAEGGTRWFETIKAPVLDAAGAPLGTVGIARNITERKEAEEQIQKSLAEKETLLRELYHRTKNNMSVIIALLELHAGRLDDEKLRSVLRDTQNRIRSMALVHQKLYETKNLSRVNLKDYIGSLMVLLMESYTVSHGRIEFDAEMEDVSVPIDIAIPCGLILNELISNALKYAFPDGRTGLVSVRLRRTADGGIFLGVADDGVGFAPGFDLRRDGSIGLQTIFALAENQLMGQLVFHTERGVACELWLKSDVYQAGL